MAMSRARSKFASCKGRLMELKHVIDKGSRDVVVMSILKSSDLRPRGGGHELPVQNLWVRKSHERKKRKAAPD
jgi:hypothetical protein